MTFPTLINLGKKSIVGVVVVVVGHRQVYLGHIVALQSSHHVLGVQMVRDYPRGG